MSRKTEIAEALIESWSTAFAGDRISQDATFARTWLQITRKAITSGPQFDHASPATGSVRVFVMAMDETPGDDGDARDRFFVNYPIQIGLAAYVKTTTNDDVDPLSTLSEELRDYCLRLDDESYSLGIPEQVLTVPQIICDPDLDALQADKLFLSIFTLTFEGARGR